MARQTTALTERHKQAVRSVLPLLMTAHSTTSLKTLINLDLPKSQHLSEDEVLAFQDKVKAVVGTSVNLAMQSLLLDEIILKGPKPIVDYLISYAKELGRIKARESDTIYQARLRNPSTITPTRISTVLRRN
jgi:hypothetical protein